MLKVRPTLRALSDEQIALVHESVLTILEKTGLRVEDDKAGQVFRQASCTQTEENRFCLPRVLVEWAIKSAPSRLDVFRRDGAPAFSLDSQASGGSVYGIGGTNLYYHESLTNNVVPFGRRHMATSTRLGEALDEYQCISTPGVIQDVDHQSAELLGSLEILANTAKPLILLVSKPDAYEASLQMFDQLVGLNPGQPFIIPYLNPITPLILNADTSIKMDLAIERGLPLVFSNYGMSGASCPITPGGTLALLTAELLAGLVYSQLKKQGTPIILGSLPAVFNMRTMGSYYAASSLLINVCCAEMMAHYQIPHCGSSGGSMGRGADLSAAATLWLNHLPGQMGKVGLVPFVGSNFDSLVFSPGTVVYSAEVIRLSRQFQAGFSLHPDDVGLDEIIDLGPGNSYLTSRLTMANFRDQPPFSQIWPPLGLDQWQEEGRPKSGPILREYTRELVNGAKPPQDHDSILDAGEEFIAKNTREKNSNVR